MTDIIDTTELVELQDFRCADDNGCGVTIYIDRPRAFVAVTIETGTLIARTESAEAIAAYAAAALIAYGTDGPQLGSWSATVEQGREILADLDDHANDLVILAASQ